MDDVPYVTILPDMADPGYAPNMGRMWAHCRVGDRRLYKDMWSS